MKIASLGLSEYKNYAPTYLCMDFMDFMDFERFKVRWNGVSEGCRKKKMQHHRFVSVRGMAISVLAAQNR